MKVMRVATTNWLTSGNATRKTAGVDSSKFKLLVSTFDH